MSTDLTTALPEGQPGRGIAILSMSTAAFLFAVMSASTRMTSMPGPYQVPIAEVTFLRFLFGAAVMLPLLRRPGACLLGIDRPGLVWRGFIGGLAVYTYFMALSSTTLTHAVILNYTSVIFGPIFASIQIRERLNYRSILAIVLAFAGIAFIVKPDVSGFRPGDWWGLSSGLLAGMAITSVRRLRQTETSFAVFFYFSAIGLLVAGIGCAGGPMIWPTPEAWRVLLLMAGSSIVAQLLMTYGYGYMRTAEGALIMLSQIIYTSVIGVVLYREPIVATTVFGAVLIVGSSIWMTLSTSADSGAE